MQIVLVTKKRVWDFSVGPLQAPKEEVLLGDVGTELVLKTGEPDGDVFGFRKGGVNA